MVKVRSKCNEGIMKENVYFKRSKGEEKMEEHKVLSTDKKTNLHIVCWKTEEKPKGILQIIHGMAEFVERYAEFAEYLNQLGYLVVGHDHLGHGQSVDSENPQYGYFGEETISLVISDIHRVRTWVQADYQDIPYFMLGHSMGSFALRNYIQQYAEGLDGVILMGTGSKPAVLSVVLPVVKLLAKKNGMKKNPIIDNLAFGSFSKKFPEASPFNWLSKNQKNVAEYEKNPLTGFVFTNNGFSTLFQLIDGANKKGWGNNLPKELPILIVSGEEDPVGDFGKGPKKIQQELTESGMTQVSLTLFPELRHEILLEEDKKEVYQVIQLWMEKVV